MSSYLTLAASMAALLTATASHAQDRAPYRLAITDVEGMERLQTEWGPFRQAVEEATGERFGFLAVNNRTAAGEALRAERADFVLTGPAEYVILGTVTDAEPLVGLSRPDYYCGIIVMADSGINAPRDLAGETVAFDDVGSTSGHLCPMQLLDDYGLDPMEDIEATHTTREVGHAALKRGDVAALGANYTSWVEQVRAQDDSTPPGAFRVVARSGDLPNDLIMVGSHVDRAAAEEIRADILENRTAIVEAITSVGGENTKYNGMDIVPLEDTAYDSVRAMFGTIDQPQYTGDETQ